MADWKSTILDGAHQNGTRSGPGAIPITGAMVFLTTTGADALTVADGEAGQHLFITMVTDGGAGTISSATTSLKSYTTIVFDDVGDYICLRFDGRQWVLVGYRGVTLT